MDALKNSWYPAAWSKDVGTQLLKRTLLNESMVFFRIGDGASDRSRQPAPTFG
jgi:phenylpropionate dioxygenase-like ring-hydroxylating dioxygenase large terminal subunit